MKNWQKAEEIIKLIEQTISPESKVERNIWLPNLSSNKGAKCQCDVVIRNGKPPRETISIVEVQDRGKKVEINTFRGWCEKMRDVGAQHLICVSEKGFPESIIEKAMQMGPTVRLLTLTQLKSNEEWPLNFFSNTINNPRRVLHKIHSAFLKYENEKITEQEKMDINLDEPNFQYNGNWVNANSLFFEHLNHLENQVKVFENGKHTIELKLPMSGDDFKFKIGNALKNVTSFSAIYEVDILNRKMQFALSKYKQIDYENSIAWMMETSVYLKDRETKIKIVLVPLENGFYRVNSTFI